MADIVHGDLVEQRVGGLDDVRRISNDLLQHEQCAAIHFFESTSPNQGHWLIFRFGVPVLAYSDLASGLEALIEIERIGLETQQQIHLYEMELKAVHEAMRTSPEALLQLIEPEHRGSSEQWWTSRRQSTHALHHSSNLDEMHAFVAEQSAQVYTPAPRHAQSDTLLLQRGTILSYDGMVNEELLKLAEHILGAGRPALIILGEPVSELSPLLRSSPSVCTLIVPQHELMHCDDEASLKEAIQTFLWGNDHAFVLLSGLHRYAHLFGEDSMREMYRWVVDMVRKDGHVLLNVIKDEHVTFTSQRLFKRESHLLSQSALIGWLSDLELFDQQPFFVPLDEDEQAWIEYSLRHSPSPTKGFEQSPELTGGNEVISVEEQRAITTELTNALNDFVEQREEFSSRATEPHPGRFLSDIPLGEVEDGLVPYRRRQKAKHHVHPEHQRGIRQPQKLPRRKPEPHLPPAELSQQERTNQSLKHASLELPDFKANRAASSFIHPTNLAAINDQIEQATAKVKPAPVPKQMAATKDLANLKNGPQVHALPESKFNMPYIHKGNSKTSDLEHRREGSTSPAPSQARERVHLPQHQSTPEDALERWEENESKRFVQNTTLYDQDGKKFRRYRSGDA